MNNEKEYKTPVITVINFENEDVIRTSSGSFGGDDKANFWNDDKI